MLKLHHKDTSHSSPSEQLYSVVHSNSVLNYIFFIFSAWSDLLCFEVTFVCAFTSSTLVIKLCNRVAFEPGNMEKFARSSVLEFFTANYVLTIKRLERLQLINYQRGNTSLYVLPTSIMSYTNNLMGH